MAVTEYVCEQAPNSEAIFVNFLIRDPAKVATSMAKHWPDFVLKESAFVEQRALFDRLADKLGEAPPVIDSDDLLENPQGIVEAYCSAVGIPYIPEASDHVKDIYDVCLPHYQQLYQHRLAAT